MAYKVCMNHGGFLSVHDEASFSFFALLPKH